MHCVINCAIIHVLMCVRPEMTVKFGFTSEPMIGDLSRIVIEGFTIPENSVHKIIFVK